ncbi:MAG: hypothetical protein Q9M27_02810 [Mariprofundaceae bacterium]|nr:hypothetical protein [Mariprofundaceae bacterium]
MRIVIMLTLALALAGVLAMFPHVADQPLRIEAFGWLFESRQGPFILLLLLLLGLFWMLRRSLAAIFAGPGQVWQVLRSGGRQRREARLRDGLAELIDMRGDLGAKAFRKTRGIAPVWGRDLLRALTISAVNHIKPSTDSDALLTALRARIVTDPSASPKPDMVTRKAHLDAWLNVHPGAPMALQRKMDMAEEEEDWTALTRLLEDMWKKGGRSAASIRPRLASAYMALAAAQPDHALEYLRKAHRLMPEDGDVLLSFGETLIEQGDAQTCRKLWSAHLETYDDEPIAIALHELLRTDALKAYRKLEKVNNAKMPPAQAWLRAKLAHDADLGGLAVDHLQELIKSHPGAMAWKTFGDWHAETADWVQAARCYQKALEGDSRPSGVDNSESVN